MPTRGNETQDAPLHLAVRYSENPEITDALLAHGADVAARNQDGDTALHRSARYNRNPAITETLLDHGANINAQNSDGETPCQVLGSNIPARVEQLLCG